MGGQLRYREVKRQLQCRYYVGDEGQCTGCFESTQEIKIAQLK